MTGSPTDEDRGLIPRSVEHIIRHIHTMRANGWEVEATYSMLEVYNESLIDLLGSLTDVSTVTDASKNKLKITMHNDRVTVTHLTSIPMDTASSESALDQLDDILGQASRARTTASTAMNERSSRSHVLFMMNLQATHRDGTVMQGGLRLVDLAGSERLDRAGTLTDAARLRETVNINKSLSCLGEVFIALGNKASHIPYRNSKLTMLLQVGCVFISSSDQSLIQFSFVCCSIGLSLWGWENSDAR
jgi:kinesin family member C1